MLWHGSCHSEVVRRGPDFCFSQRADCVLISFGRYGRRLAKRYRSLRT